MIQGQFHIPALNRWQGRLARVPRSVWLAFFLGAMIPVVALLASALIMGLMVVAAVLVVVLLARMVRRIFHRPRRRSMSREIVVSAVRVVDP